jgi:hypothetical protein
MSYRQRLVGKELTEKGFKVFIINPKLEFMVPEIKIKNLPKTKNLKKSLDNETKRMNIYEGNIEPEKEKLSLVARVKKAWKEA